MWTTSTMPTTPGEQSLDPDPRGTSYAVFYEDQHQAQPTRIVVDPNNKVGVMNTRPLMCYDHYTGLERASD